MEPGLRVALLPRQQNDPPSSIEGNGGKGRPRRRWASVKQRLRSARPRIHANSVHFATEIPSSQYGISGDPPRLSPDRIMLPGERFVAA